MPFAIPHAAPRSGPLRPRTRHATPHHATPQLEVDTQSADFFRLTSTLYHAYPRVEGSERHQKHAWHRHRRAHKTKNDDRLVSIFLSATEAVADGVIGQNCVAGAAGDARADRPCRPKTATPHLRQHSRLGRHLAAPRRLAATSSGSGTARRARSRRKRARIPPRSRSRGRP